MDARMSALSVAHLWEMPPLVRQALETGEQSIALEAFHLAQDGTRSAASLAAVDAISAAMTALLPGRMPEPLAAETAAWDAASALAYQRCPDATWGSDYRNHRQAILDATGA